ncbi:hypothetical protein B0H14DRAFT_3578296 [Mycena olivaceomarginata]|nr:hypothetical protein B0H14DRAFT_3578296 [Mycena olivaceomarginata]
MNLAPRDRKKKKRIEAAATQSRRLRPSRKQNELPPSLLHTGQAERTARLHTGHDGPRRAQARSCERKVGAPPQRFLGGDVPSENARVRGRGCGRDAVPTAASISLRRRPAPYTHWQRRAFPGATGAGCRSAVDAPRKRGQRPLGAASMDTPGQKRALGDLARARSPGPGLCLESSFPLAGEYEQQVGTGSARASQGVDGQLRAWAPWDWRRRPQRVRWDVKPSAAWAPRATSRRGEPDASGSTGVRSGSSTGARAPSRAEAGAGQRFHRGASSEVTCPLRCARVGSTRESGRRQACAWWVQSSEGGMPSTAPKARAASLRGSTPLFRGHVDDVSGGAYADGANREATRPPRPCALHQSRCNQLRRGDVRASSACANSRMRTWRTTAVRCGYAVTSEVNFASRSGVRCSRGAGIRGVPWAYGQLCAHRHAVVSASVRAQNGGVEEQRRKAGALEKASGEPRGVSGVCPIPLAVRGATARTKPAGGGWRQWSESSTGARELARWRREARVTPSTAALLGGDVPSENARV